MSTTAFSAASSTTFAPKAASFPKQQKKKKHKNGSSTTTTSLGGGDFNYSNKGNNNNNNSKGKPHLIQTTHYDGVYLHDTVGRLTLTPDKILFQPLDRSDTEHHFGWGWESLEKHVISAPPPPLAGSHEVDQCWVKLISHEDRHKTVLFHLAHDEREALERLHRDISDKMAGLRKYRKVKTALLESRMKHREAHRTIGELQERNRQLLDSLQTAAQKATELDRTCQEQTRALEVLRAENERLRKTADREQQLQQLRERVEQLQNERTARAMEHEMDQQDWKHQKWELERQLKDARADLERHKKDGALEELKVEIRLLSKEVLQLQDKNTTLLQELWAQEAEYEEMLWQVRKQRNNAWLEVKRVQEERDSWKKMKGPVESQDEKHQEEEEAQQQTDSSCFKTKEEYLQEPPQDGPLSIAHEIKVPLSQSALYGKIFQTLHYNTGNSNNVADLQQYYENMCQMASRSEDGLTLLQRELESLLEKERMPYWQNYYHLNDQVPATHFHIPALYYERLGLSSTSSYSVLGYCSIDCKVRNKSNNAEDRAVKALQLNFAPQGVPGNPYQYDTKELQHQYGNPYYTWAVPNASSSSLPNNKSNSEYYRCNRHEDDEVGTPVMLDSSWIHSHVRAALADDASSRSRIQNVVATLDHANKKNNIRSISNKDILSSGTTTTTSIDFQVRDILWQYDMTDGGVPSFDFQGRPPQRTPSKIRAEETLHALAFAY